MAETNSIQFKHDLCPRKPNKLVMDLGNTEVTILVQVSAKKKPSPIVLKRLKDLAAMPVAVEYEKVVQSEVDRLQAKFLDMVKKRNAKGANELAKETTLSVKNACAALQSAVSVAVKEQIKKDARDDQNLLEAQIKVGVKVTFTVITIGKDVATLALTAGMDVSAWYNLAKNIYTLADTINGETKDEAQRRKDLLESFGRYSGEKIKRTVLIDKATKSNKAKLELTFKQIFQSIKSEGEKVEGKRKHYKNKVTSMRQELEQLSGKAAKLEEAMKAAKGLKEGVKIGAQVMKLKGQVKTFYAALQNAETFSEQMAELLTLNGVKVDDSTFTQRLKSLKAVPDLVKFGKDLNTAAKNLQDMIGAIAPLAA